MAHTGTVRIDRLLEGEGVPPIGRDDPDADAVGVVQDLLMGHGFKHLPGPLGRGRGQFGPRTSEAISAFQRSNRLPESGVVDRATLQSLISVPAAAPSACCGYLCLVLDRVFTGMMRLMSITSQFEGAGLFTALNRNTDKAGLSFGLIQWAQKPGRLNEILRAFQTAQPALFVKIFGAGDPVAAHALLAHTAKPRGGTDDQGRTTDARFDLVSEPWVSRFIEAGSHRELQRVQVDTALRAFEGSLRQVQAFAPEIRSERGIAFMLDLANQHGDAGAKRIFTTVKKPGLSELELLVAIQEESIGRVRQQFGEGREVESTRHRREAFRTSALLSDEVFTVA